MGKKVGVKDGDDDHKNQWRILKTFFPIEFGHDYERDKTGIQMELRMCLDERVGRRYISEFAEQTDLKEQVKMWTELNYLIVTCKKCLADQHRTRMLKINPPKEKTPEELEAEKAAATSPGGTVKPRKVESNPIPRMHQKSIKVYETFLKPGADRFVPLRNKRIDRDLALMWDRSAKRY